MRVLPYLTTALASASTVLGQSNQPCKSVLPADQSDPRSPGHSIFDLGGLVFGGSLVSSSQAAPKPEPTEVRERGLEGYQLLSTRYNKCVDVPSGKFINGQAPQIWDCNSGSPNQQWKLAGNLLRTGGGKCLDVPFGWVYPGAPVQLYACDANNRNQWFEAAGSSIRKKNTNYCLDIRDGRFDNGGSLQLFSCDWNWGGGNQLVSFSKPAAQPANNPSAFLGYAAISVERFGQLHPECAPWVGFFKAAAAGTGLHPTLIAAIAENESTCNERPRNGAGLMQFMDENAFRQFGGGDKQKASDAIWAGARYMRYLLDRSGQNLDAALRAYNGPVAQGGDPDYQRNIRTWMSGGSTW